MKKSLKKSLFILLTLLSVFFIVACGDKLSKKEVIEKFIESDKNIKSADLTITMKIEQKNSTNPAGISMEASGYLSVILEPALAMKMDITVPFSNNKLAMYMNTLIYKTLIIINGLSNQIKVLENNLQSCMLSPMQCMTFF